MEEDTGLLIPATKEFQDRFLEERIRALVFARVFLYSMNSDCVFDVLNFRRAFRRALIDMKISSDYHGKKREGWSFQPLV